MQRIGLEPEGRKYTPHVTLARLRDSSSREVADYLAARGLFRSLPFRGLALRAVLLARLGRRRALCGRGGLSAGGMSEPSGRRAAAATARRASRWRSRGRRRPFRASATAAVERGGVDLADHAAEIEARARRRTCARVAACARCRRGKPCAASLMPRLRAASSVRSSSAEPTPWLCHGCSMLKAASASSRERRADGAQLGGAAQRAVDEEAVDHDAELGERCGIAAR